jgi:CBS domain containing-hemolysin-like protein
MRLDPASFATMQGDHETMAGLMLELAGEIPAAGTEIHRDGFHFTAVEVAKHRILRVKVQHIPSTNI